MSTLAYLPVGAAFGFVLEKAKVHVPLIILDQLSMPAPGSKYIMLQTFLAASAASLVSIHIMQKMGYAKSPRPPMALGFGYLRGYGANIVGGSLLGMGMAMAGACPGTVFVQLGTGVATAPTVILGAICSTTVFGYITRHIADMVPNFMKKGKPIALASESSPVSENALVMLLATGLAFAVYAVNSVFPWQKDMTSVVSNFIPSTGVFSPFAIGWNPLVAGSAIGLIQVASNLLTGNSIGCSTAYVIAAGDIAKSIDSKIDQRAPYFRSFLNAGQGPLLLGVGMTLGAFFSAWLSGSILTPSATMGVASLATVSFATHARAFTGGALLLFGARLAGGCTSGHGITGLAHLGRASFISTAAMFAGGMAASWLL